MKAFTCIATALAVIAFALPSGSYAQNVGGDLAAVAVSAQTSPSGSDTRPTGELMGDSALSLVTTTLPVSAPIATNMGGTDNSTAMDGSFQGDNALNAGQSTVTGGQVTDGQVISGQVTSITTPGAGGGMFTGTPLAGSAMPAGAGGWLLGGGLVGTLIPGH